MKQGRFVGIVETSAESPGLPGSVLSQLAEQFAATPDEPDEAIPDARLPSASIVIPSLVQNPAGLHATISSLRELDYPTYEIIVVDNRSSEDGAVSIAELAEHDRVSVIVIKESFPGISAARNAGIAAATGAFVAFIDDDAVADRNWLRALGSRFVQDPEVQGIGGLVLPRELDTEPQLWFEEYYSGYNRSFDRDTLSLERLAGTDRLFPFAPGRFGTGCNMAFRRTALEQVGGFNTSLGTGTPGEGGEDLAMFIQLILSGGTLAFEPAAVVRHSHRRTKKEFLHKVFCYGTGLTAMYTALVIRNPRYLAAMIPKIPAGIRLLTRPRSGRSPSGSTSYPRRSLLYQLIGMAYGPVAYARSTARTRHFR